MVPIHVRGPIAPVEVHKILNSPDMTKLQGLIDRAILSTLFFTGCRVYDVRSLKVKDFYYEEQGFYVLDFWVKGGKRNHGH